jgi:hypothetical protein
MICGKPINKIMRIQDIFESDVKFDIDEKKNGEAVSFYATARGEKPEIAAQLVITDSTITQIDVNEDVKHYSDAMFELLKFVCKRQDEQNIPLALVADKVKSSMKRKFENFGFVMGEDNIMIRRPGATLPITFI